MNKKPGALRFLLLASTMVVPLALAAQDGADLFRQNCAPCHAEKGAGAAGLAPPLQNAELWRVLGEDSAYYLLAVMRGGLSGRIRSQGLDYIGLAMPPQAHVKPEEMQEIARYVLETLNGAKANVSFALLAEVAKASPSHKELRSARNGKPGLSSKVASK
ncbi:MAG: cytochrome c [Zoogloeaceae bacterium]|jgi:mono/diheme cytochrome c family protein|nr:cytochrome c [Zoogloeaceae bacterium]